MPDGLSSDQLVATSKFLSLVLRHDPESIGVTMDTNGWVDVDELVARSADGTRQLSVELISQVVETSSKQRFVLSDDGTRIRANQGHSIDVDLRLEAATPPAVLFHGTADRFLEAILDKGLLAGARTHVHLSEDVETATTVGRRHGRPVVLTVDCAAMVGDGSVFQQAENGVWLVDHVQPRFLRLVETS